MNKNVLFELTLFDPENTLITLLKEREVEYRKVPATQKFVVAMDETIEVVKKDNIDLLLKNLASIFVSWLKANKNRKLQVQLVDGSIVYIEENDITGATNILNDSLKITAFDPEYNNRILNK